jgi:hypothetical protein
LTAPTGLGLLGVASRRGFSRSGSARLGRSQKDGLPTCREGYAFRFKAINSRTREGQPGRCPFLIGWGNGRQEPTDRWSRAVPSPQAAAEEAAGIMPSRAPNPKRRALELLAASRDGCTEAIMLAHGFTVEQMVDLCVAGLVTATPERIVAGGRTIEVATMRITEAGRRALDAGPKGRR